MGCYFLSSSALHPITNMKFLSCVCRFSLPVWPYALPRVSMVCSPTLTELSLLLMSQQLLLPVLTILLPSLEQVWDMLAMLQDMPGMGMLVLAMLDMLDMVLAMAMLQLPLLLLQDMLDMPQLMPEPTAMLAPLT